MSKELYSCKVELSKNDIDKMLKIFRSNSGYKKYIKSLKDDYEVLFYEEYLVCVKEEEIKYLYSDFINVIETDTDFYFLTDTEVIFVPKRDMDYKFNSFIRRTFDDIDNRIGEDTGIKEIGKLHDSKVMKKVLFILLIVTVLSFFLALVTWYLVIQYYNLEEFMKNSYRWVMLFYLPIPIVTTIVGWIYYQRGHSCMKNVVVGAIVFFAILGFGVSAFRRDNVYYEFQKDISFLNNYKDIMKLPVIPKEGRVYYLDNYEECYTLEGKTNSCEYLIAEIEDYDKFEKYLFDSEYWNSNEDIPDELKKIIMDYPTKTYYSIYNKTLDEYNIVPSVEGKYEFYIMEYIPSLAYLRIIKIDYDV